MPQLSIIIEFEVKHRIVCFKLLNYHQFELNKAFDKIRKCHFSPIREQSHTCISANIWVFDIKAVC